MDSGIVADEPIVADDETAGSAAPQIVADEPTPKSRFRMAASHAPTAMENAPLPAGRVSRFTPPQPKGPTLPEEPLLPLSKVVSDPAFKATLGAVAANAPTLGPEATEIAGKGIEPLTTPTGVGQAVSAIASPAVGLEQLGEGAYHLATKQAPELAGTLIGGDVEGAREQVPEVVASALMTAPGLVHARAMLAREGIHATDVEVQAASDQLAREGRAPAEGPEAGRGGEATGAGAAAPVAAPGEGYPREGGARPRFTDIEEVPAGQRAERNAPEAQPLLDEAGARVVERGAEAGPEETGGPVQERGEPVEEPVGQSVGAAAANATMDRGPALSRVIQEKPSDISQAARWVREQLSPAQIDEPAQKMAGLLRENMAAGALKQQQFTNTLNPGLLKEARGRGVNALVELDRLTPEQQDAFFDAAEQGAPQATPKLDAIAKALRERQDTQARDLAASGLLGDVIQNYMPHQYENPQVGLQLFDRGARGSSIPSWQKERTYPLRAEAKATGLTPKFQNPVEDVITSTDMKERYLAIARSVRGAVEDGVIVPWDSNTAPAPGTDLVKLDPKFVRMAGDYVEEGQTLAAPRSVALLLDRVTQQGLEGNPAYRLYRSVAGGLNQMQLLGPFHGFTSAFNSFYSRMSDGVTQMLRAAFEPGVENRLGELGHGVAEVATSPIAPVMDGIIGYKARRAALESTGLPTGDVDLILKGGHRIDMSEDYTMNAITAFRRAIAQDKYLRAVGTFPGAVLEAAMTPIMKVVVPSLKTGHYLEAAATELRRLGPDASDAAKRQALGRVEDAVSDRFGQLPYDNQFWNKTARNMAQILMRSPGWVAGSLRAGLGGLKDVVKVPSRFAAKVAGTAPETMDPVITQRMGYLVAQTIGPMLVGSLYGYLKNEPLNSNKQSYTDYVAPKTGGRTKAGAPERYVPAGYTKEGFAWTRDPAGTLLAKRNPLISLAIDESRGKDFMDTPIVNPEAPPLARLGQRAEYAAEQMAPIFTRGTIFPDPNINPRTNIGLVERMAGAPAPRYMTPEAQSKENKREASRFIKKRRQ